ncbi:MAG: hypothetical protein ABI430_01105 [Candidatus Taylorbacteria bacterium]
MFQHIGNFIKVLHLPVFVISLLICFSFFAFKDTSGPLPLSFRIINWTVATYPLVYLAGFLLGKYVNPNFIWLPCINLLIIVGFLVNTFVIGSIIDSSAQKGENLQRLQTIPRDFVCDDGSFFSIAKTGDPDYSNLNYYDTYSQKNLSDFYSPFIGVISRGKAVIDLDKKREKDMGDNIRQKLNSCKNTDGKALLELYPLE